MNITSKEVLELIKSNKKKFLLCKNSEYVRVLLYEKYRVFLNINKVENYLLELHNKGELHRDLEYFDFDKGCIINSPGYRIASNTSLSHPVCPIARNNTK